MSSGQATDNSKNKPNNKNTKIYKQKKNNFGVFILKIKITKDKKEVSKINKTK